jgi:hypothetical protein
MKHTKRLSVALMAIGLSIPLVASSAVFVPSQTGGLKISLDPLYLRENSVNKAVDDTFNWGAYAQVGYLFAQTGNDLTVDYTYIRSDENHLTENKLYSIWTKGINDCDLDSIDLEGGQRIIGGPFDVRLFAGINYTHLDHHLEIDNTFARSLDDKIEISEELITTFQGIGPRFGTETRYNLGYGFGLDAHFNTSLLIGSVNNKYQFNDTLRQSSSDVNRVIPKVEAKVGLDCMHCLSTKDKSAVIFEVGYQTSNYFNVLNDSGLNSSNNLSFNGAYLDIKYTA